RINAWIEKQTRDRIKDILQKGDLNRLTRLVLANAIYFKGQWSEPFDESATKPQDFTLASGTKIKVPTMTDYKQIKYAAFNADGSFFETPRTVPLGKNPNKLKNTYPGKDGFAMIELPYRGNELSMVVIVPQDPNGLPALVKNLTAEKLDGWVKKMNKRNVFVYLPKFKLETNYQLIKPLKSLGMREAFVEPDPRGGADFSGMTSSMRRDLYISKVIHKAFVEVNEKGTEAAAATVVAVAQATSVRVMVPFNPTFKADRPFLFLIRHMNTGSILFMGKVANLEG
ncbi:MAG: serpin family protein, partial [Gemmataceae bacterium]